MAKPKGKKSYKIDFSGVEKERRQRKKRIPEGDYLLKITKVERKKNKAGDAYYFNWTFQVIESASGSKKHAGVPFWYTTSLKPDALFNLRNLVFAASDGKVNLAGKKGVEFNPQKYIGAKIGGTVEDEEFEKKMRSSVVDVMPVSELVEEEEEDDGDDEDDEEEEEEEEEDSEDDEDEDDDEEDDEEDDLEDVDDDDL